MIIRRAFIGKKAVADRVSKSAEGRDDLASCGVSLHLTDKVIAMMTKFVIKYVYSDTKSVTPAAARASKWKSQRKKSLTIMIPGSDSLLHHIRRVNYLSYLQKHYQLKDHPPLNHGWHIDNGICLPTRSTLPVLPRCMSPEIREQQDSDTDSEVVTSSEDEADDESCGSDDYISDSDTE